MEKLILRCTYWLSITCLVIAVLFAYIKFAKIPRTLAGSNILWNGKVNVVRRIAAVGLLMLVASIATSNLIWSRGQQQ
jgi:hypothetical protein